MAGRLLHFRGPSEASAEDRSRAWKILDVPAEERASRSGDLEIENPENLLALSACLHEQLYTSPMRARAEAEFFYRFLEKPPRAIGLFDERDFFLGEFALTAGTACRQLSLRDEARTWFDRAELWFRKTASAATDLARLAYQRLALRVEERQLDVVLELSPPLRQSFEDLRMPEEALKCRFLEGVSLVETGRVEEAIQVMEEISDKAEKIGSRRLLSLAFTNLTHYHGMLGNPQQALRWSKKAVSLLRVLDDRVGLAKVQWGLANLFRETGQTNAAINAYRAARTEFASLRMQADVAALTLVVADLLLEAGNESEATKEVVTALPVIDELKMVPEGLAALALLRESVRQRRINRQALRDLHGYFEETQK